MELYIANNNNLTKKFKARLQIEYDHLPIQLH